MLLWLNVNLCIGSDLDICTEDFLAQTASIGFLSWKIVSIVATSPLALR